MENIKSSCNINKLKYLLQHGVRNLNFLIDHIQYQIFKIILSIFLINIKKVLIIHQSCVNKIENRITFKIKTGYYLELLTPETMKLLGSTETKITKEKNGPPHIEHVKLIVHSNIFNNDYQQDSRILYTFVPNKPFRSLLGISLRNHTFLKIFNSEFQEVKVWLTDQNSTPLEIEHKITLTLIIK